MIRRLLIRLRAMRTYARYIAPPDPAVTWTKDDAGMLHRYLTSPEGQKFRAALQNQEAAQNAMAVLAPRRNNGLEYAAGMAAGFRAAHAWILALSGDLSRTEATQKTDEADAGETALIDKYSP